MAQITDNNGSTHLISEDEANRGILVDRLQFYAEKEQDKEEKALLQNLADWIGKVSFA